MDEKQGEQEESSVNEVQRLYLELFKRSRFNLLDGQKVVNDLLEWRHLWYSVFPRRLPSPVIHAPDRFPELYERYPSLLTRWYDLQTDFAMLHHARWDSCPFDMLYIWTTDEKLPELQRRIEERWQIDDTGVLSPDEDMEMHIAMLGLDKIHDRVLWVWWD